MGTSAHPADVAVRKAQQGEALSVNDRWAIHRRLLHLRGAADLRVSDDLQRTQELIGIYNQALSSGR